MPCFPLSTVKFVFFVWALSLLVNHLVCFNDSLAYRNRLQHTGISGWRNICIENLAKAGGIAEVYRSKLGSEARKRDNIVTCVYLKTLTVT